MNTWSAMVSSRLLLFSPAIFMLIAVVIGQPAFDLNSFCSSGESDCTAKRTSDACFQHHLRRSSLSSYTNGSPHIHLRLPHSNGSNIVDLFMWNTPFCQTDFRLTMVLKTPGKNRISWRSLPRAAAAPGKERNCTSRYVVLTVAVLLTVTYVLLIIASTCIYIRAKMARKNVGVVTGTMPGEGNEELLTMRSPFKSMTMGSQQKVGQATGTSQYSSKLQEALDKFDTGSNDSQPVSHFYCFDGNVEKFLRFTIPREGVPLLEKLHSRYGDFTAECRLGNMVGSIFLKLLAAILLDIRRVPLKDLDITVFSSGAMH
ncbi:hypothetical protein F2P56_006579 [Juglans regia]|uniref:Uncharacterized protein n=1 Tax=Juglans regia TaxID=51240 RepID=A0A833XZS1_JUGRE|nr:hypothetical protein F2P56_006579 [Juglans regia]